MPRSFFVHSDISRTYVHTWYTYSCGHGQWQFERLVSLSLSLSISKTHDFVVMHPPTATRFAFDRYRITPSNSTFLSSYINYKWHNYTYRCFKSISFMPIVIPRTFTFRQTSLIESFDSCQLEMAFLLRFTRHFLS